MTPPGSKEEWLEISKKFEEVGNMLHVIGCIDGKHIKVGCPKLSGMLYYNCKGFFSIVLMALSDANYCFTLYDLGQYGSNNDSGIFANPEMSKMFEENQLNDPPDCILPEDDKHSLPYFLLGDEVFLLKKWLMQPYYRHSRAWQCIENAFVILTARWRIFHKAIRATVENVENYTLACLALHNYSRLMDNAHYTPSGFVNSEDKDGNFLLGE